MSVFFAEFLPALGATGLFLFFLVSSGGLFAKVFRFPGYDALSGVARQGVALFCAFAVLPVLLDLAGRISPGAIPFVAALTTCVGVPELLRNCRRPDGRTMGWALAAGVWIVVSLGLVIDWPDGSGGITHSLTAVDYVKHTEATWAIAQTGAPPVNPAYFSADDRASYYYFFYTLTAAVSVLSGALFGAEPRHAAFAAAPISGLALFALISFLWSRARLGTAVGALAEDPPPAGWIVALLLTSGPDILMVLRHRLARGEWLMFPEGWSQQVTSWFDSAVWAPHHVASLIAALAGFAALAGPGARGWRQTIFAGLAFASMAGMSVYIAMGAALTVSLWLCLLLGRRRLGDACWLLGAGALSAALAAPWLHSIIGRISSEQAAIAFALRNADLMEFSTGSIALDFVFALLLMLTIYAINFGFFLLGAYAYWRKAGRDGLHTDLALLLGLSALASLVIGSFFRSTVVQNDLGWRVMLFAQLAMLLWTLAALRAGVLRWRSPAALFFLAAGYASVAYGALQMRLYPWRIWPSETDRAMLVDEKRAWEWVNANLPTDAVAQARPTGMDERAFGYGLYAKRRAALADTHVGILFGAPVKAAQARAAELSPIFEDKALSPAEVDRLAARYGVKAIVVTGADPVFGALGAWTQAHPPAFSAPHARVYLRH